MIAYLFYLIAYPLLLIGFARFGKNVAAMWQKRQRHWKPLGMENGIVGFYALLTSFTLVQSGNMARDRELMVHTVADDLSEILRVSLTYEPQLQTSIRHYFADFHTLIQQPFEPSRAGVYKVLKVIDKRDDAFDAEMQQYANEHPAEREKIAGLLGKIDRMESVYYRFMHSYHRTMPQLILMILVLFSVLISFLMGFVEKYHGNHIYISSIIFIIICVIILNVIHDLDNPAYGFLQPSLDDVKEVMQTFGIIQ